MWLNFIFQRPEPAPFLEALLYHEAARLSLTGYEAFPTPFSYHFALEGSHESLLAFAENLSKNLPLSLFFSFERLEPLESLPDSFVLIEGRESTQEELSPLEIARFLPKERSIPALPFEATFRLAGREWHAPSGAELYEAFEALATRVAEGGSILVDTRRGRYEISLKARDCKASFMACDLASAEVMFRASSAEISALATWEKPTIELPPKGLFLERFEGVEYPQGGVEVGLPYDLALTILAHFWREREIEVVALSPSDSVSGEGFFSENLPPLPALKVALGEDGTLIVIEDERLEACDSYPELLSLLQEQHGVEQGMALHLSAHAPSYFWLLQGAEKRSLMRFELPLSPANLWERIATQSETSARLSHNFATQFPELAARIQATHAEGISENLNDWLAMAGFFLGFVEEWDIAKAQAALHARAKGFLGSKGPRVDFALYKDEAGRVSLDKERVIRSCMSFKLAGVDEETLAFGVVDSFAEFWGNLLRDMSENFAVSSVILSGDLLAHRPFLNKLIQYTPKHLKLHFPLRAPLDIAR